MAHPTRHLCGDKPHRYVSAEDTDIRRTFRRARLLERLRQAGLSDRAPLFGAGPDLATVAPRRPRKTAS